MLVTLFLSFQACFVTVVFDYFSFWPTRSSLLAWMGTITEKRSRLSLQIVVSSIQEMYAEKDMSQRSLENSLQSVPTFLRAVLVTACQSSVIIFIKHVWFCDLIHIVLQQ